MTVDDRFHRNLLILLSEGLTVAVGQSSTDLRGSGLLSRVATQLSDWQAPSRFDLLIATQAPIAFTSSDNILVATSAPPLSGAGEAENFYVIVHSNAGVPTWARADAGALSHEVLSRARTALFSMIAELFGRDSRVRTEQRHDDERIPAYYTVVRIDSPIESIEQLVSMEEALVDRFVAEFPNAEDHFVLICHRRHS